MAKKITTTEEKKTEGPVMMKKVLAPYITEKASMQSSGNVYTFLVANNATKRDVIDEIKKEHKVTPLSVNIINTPRVKVFVRGKFGMKSGKKKAMVFLKRGDTIKLS